jgi:hypothetical protein
MLLSEFSQNIGPYLLENQYGVPGDKIASTYTRAFILPVFFAIVSEIFIGIAYDLFGRKKPLLISYMITSIGLMV